MLDPFADLTVKYAFYFCSSIVSDLELLASNCHILLTCRDLCNSWKS